MKHQDLRVAEPKRLDQYAVLAELAADRSTWIDIRAYPSTVVCRMMIALADWAADEPERWHASILKFEHPGMCVGDMAKKLSISIDAAHAAIRSVKICREESSSPERPKHGFRVSLTYYRGILLAERSSRFPVQWRCWRLRAMVIPQRQVAEILGVSQQRVSQLLLRPMLTNSEMTMRTRERKAQ